MIKLEHVSKSYSAGIPALNDVSLNIEEGEFVFVVGDSGSGKSTLIKLLLKELEPTEGTITINGRKLNKIRRRQIPKFRRNIGVVFQDFRLLKDRNIYDNVAFAQKVIGESNRSIKKNVPKLLSMVGLAAKYRSYPRQLSGGEQQRVAIARALINKPKILLADEPTTALDVTIQAQILELMKKIQQDKGMSILLITHDLGVVAEMCSRVIVMYAGKIVEEAPVEILFANPTHPYTQGLIASVPKLGSGVKVLPSIPGSVPDLSAMPKGCRFAPRCKYATEKCHQEQPELLSVGEKQKCRCWLKH